MSIQVKKNTINPRGTLYHNSLIKLLILYQLKERNQPKLIAELWQENKDLHLQLKVVEDLNKAINSSHNTQQERRVVLKSQAKKLKFKSPVSSSKSKLATNMAQPSS